MKCGITGHTSGLGKFLFDHYINLGWSVKGFSRSNGYDIEKDYSKIIEESLDLDIFFNNAHSSDKQSLLLSNLVNRIPKIIVSGSEIRKFSESNNNNKYIFYKKQLYNQCESLSKDPSCKTDILHLGISFLENKKDKVNYVISYSEIQSLIDFWILNPSIAEVSYNWKCDSAVAEILEKLK